MSDLATTSPATTKQGRRPSWWAAGSNCERDADATRRAPWPDAAAHRHARGTSNVIERLPNGRFDQDAFHLRYLNWPA